MDTIDQKLVDANKRIDGYMKEYAPSTTEEVHEVAPNEVSQETFQDKNIYEDTGIFGKGLNLLKEASNSVFDTDFRVTENKYGKRFSTANKIFNEDSEQDVMAQFNKLQDNPNAEKSLYYLRINNPDGSSSYKLGIAEADAIERYKDQSAIQGENGTTFDVLMDRRVDNAEEFENYVHGNKNILGYRRTDYGMKYKDKANIGAGITEVYNKDILGLDDGSITQEKLNFLNLDRVHKYKALYGDKAVQKLIENDESISDRKNTGFLESTAKNLASSTVSILADVAGTLNKVVAASGDDSVIFKPIEEGLRGVKEWIGYEHRSKSGAALIQEYELKGLSLDLILNGIDTGFETAVESVPYMVGLSAKAGVKGLSLLVAASTNDIAEDIAKNNGRENVTYADLIQGATTATASILTEKIAFDRVFEISGKSIGSMVPKRMTEAEFRGKTVAVVATSVATKLAKSFGVEATQEGIQGAITDIGSTLGTDEGIEKGFRDIKENTLERMLVGGLAGGVTSGGAQSVYGATKLAGFKSRKVVTEADAAVQEADTIEMKYNIIADTLKDPKTALQPGENPMSELQRLSVYEKTLLEYTADETEEGAATNKELPELYSRISGATSVLSGHLAEAMVAEDGSGIQLLDTLADMVESGKITNRDKEAIVAGALIINAEEAGLSPAYADNNLGEPEGMEPLPDFDYTDAEFLAYTEEVVVEEVIKANEVVVEDVTSETETHINGVDTKTIERLAKTYNLDVGAVRTMLRSAVPNLSVRKMKAVSKESNKTQYDIYYGKNGVLPMYTMYRAMLLQSKPKEAVKAITKVQDAGYNQERRLRRYETAYNDMLGKVTKAITEARAKASSRGMSDVELIKQYVGTFSSFKIPNSTHTVQVKEILKDIESLTSAEKEALGVKPGVSSTKAIMDSMQESIDTIDQLLANSGLTRRKYTGKVTQEKDVVPKLEDKVAKLKAMIASIPQDDISELDAGSIKNMDKQIADLLTDIDKLSNSGEYSQTARFSADKTFANIDEDITKLEELNTKDTLTDADKASKSKLEKVVKEYNIEEETAKHVSKNKGKAVDANESGRDVKGEYQGANEWNGYDVTKEYKADEIHGLVVDMLTNTRDYPDSPMKAQFIANNVVVINDIARSIKDTDKNFVPTTAQEEVKGKADKIVELREEAANIQGSASTSTGENTMVSSELRKEVEALIGKAGFTTVLQNTKMIQASEEAIEVANATLKVFKLKKAKLAKSIDKSIKTRADKLGGDKKLLANIVEELSAAGTVANEQGSAGTKKQAKEWFAKYSKVSDKVKESIKGLHNVLFRFANLVSNSQLNKAIKKLEKEIAGQEVIKVKAESNVAEVLTKSNMTKIVERQKLRSDVRKIAKVSTDNIAILKEGKSKAVAIYKEIAELRKELFSSAVVLDAMADWGTAKEIEADNNKSDSKEFVQRNNPNKYFDTRNTLIGGVPIRELLGLIEDPTDRADISAILEDSVPALGRVIGDWKNPSFMTQDAPFLTILLNSKGEVNKSIADVIALVGTDWAGANGASNLFNDKDEVARMLGVFSYEVSSAQSSLLKDKGTLRKVMANSLGAQLLSMLGLSQKKVDGVTALEYEKMVTSAGLVMLAYLQGKGLVESVPDTYITAEDWNMVVRPDVELTPEQNVNMVKSVRAMKGEYTRLGKLGRVVELAFDVDPLTKSYKTKKPNKPDSEYKEVRNSEFEAPEALGKTRRIAEETEYSAVAGISDKMKEVYGEGEAGRLVYLESVGWKDIAKMKLVGKNNGYKDEYSFDDVEKQMSVNKSLEKEYDSLVRLHEEVDTGKIANKLWFDWFITKTFRFTLDSAGVHPQNDKYLSRWAVVPTESQNATHDINSEEFLYFKHGLAQAMGIGIDKEYSTKEELIADVKSNLTDKKYSTESAADALLKAASDTDAIAKMIKAIRDPKDGVVAVSVDGVTETLDTDTKPGKFTLTDENGIEITYKPEHPAHALGALVALEAYVAARNRGDATFKATMLAEYDAVTSGFQNKILQAQLLDDTVGHARKVGTFIEDENGGNAMPSKSMSSYIASAVEPDSYKSTASKVSQLEVSGNKVIETVWEYDRETNSYSVDSDSTEIMESMREVSESTPVLMENGEVTSAGRNMFKYPFMTFNYAAGISTIKKNLSEELATNVLGLILNGNYDDKADGKFIKGVLAAGKLGTLEELKTKMRTKSMAGSKELVTIMKLFNGSYGYATDKVMNATYGPYVRMNETIINATKIMFQVFIKRFEKDVRAKEKELNRPLSQVETKEIVVGLHEVFPMLAAPLSDGTIDSMAIVDTELVGRDEKTDIGKPKLMFKNKEGEDVGSSADTMLRKFKQAHAAGAVMPFLGIDATIIKVMLDLGILGIHDAAVMGKDFEKNIKKLNQAVYETGKSFNLVGETLSSLLRVMGTMDPKELADIVIDDSVDEDDRITASDVLSSTMELVAEVQTGRDQLYSLDTKVHVANFPGATINSAYVANAGKVSKDGILDVNSSEHKEAFDIMLDKVMAEDC